MAISSGSLIMERSNTMRRVTVKAYGGPEQLAVETAAEVPRTGPGQVLVDVEAAGVHYIDVYQRKGIYKLPLPYPPGLEGVGRVREAREGDVVWTPPGVKHWHGA
jgi:NADPH2:quinone reductase